MATSPLQGWATPDGGDAPTNAATFAALAGTIEKQAVQRYASPAARLAKIPAAATRAGMVSFVDSLGRLEKVVADAGPWSPVMTFDTVVADGALLGTYDATKPLKIWTINRVASTDANGDAIILLGATVGSGCVLSGALAGVSSSIATPPATTALRNQSGNLVARIWINGSTLLVSNSLAVGGTIIGQ